MAGLAGGSLLLDGARRAEDSAVELGPACEGSDGQIAAVVLPVVVGSDDLGNLAEALVGSTLVEGDLVASGGRLARSARDLGLDGNDNTLVVGGGRDVNGAVVSKTRVLERVNVRQVAGLRGELNAIALDEERGVIADNLPHELGRHVAMS